jgi:hypothetical protein
VPAARFADILEVLGRHHVESIVVGGVAAVLQGAPVATFDLDVVHRRTPENIERLLMALAELEAIYRGDPRQIRPAESHLRGPGHQLLMTRLGPLDVLGTIGEGSGYEDLAASTVEIAVGMSSVRLLSLERVIAEKERIARPKDLAALPTLRATLDEVRSGRTPPSHDPD